MAWSSRIGAAIILSAIGSSLALAQDRPPLELNRAPENRIEVPAYWLGISLREPDPALLVHLKIEHGVVVDDVVPDSPAAKAGIARHDLIVKVGNAPIKEAADLLKAVGEANDGEMTLTVIRDAKERVIKATPAKRPEDRVATTPEREETPEAVRDILRLWQDKAGLRDFEFSLVGPGVLMRTEVPPLPDDMKITVEREGKKPVRIKVTQGSDSWGATETEIDTLPDVARPHVRSMLGLPQNDADSRPALRVRSFRDDPLTRIEQELKQLRQEVQEIRKGSEKK